MMRNNFNITGNFIVRSSARFTQNKDFFFSLRICDQANVSAARKTDNDGIMMKSKTAGEV